MNASYGIKAIKASCFGTIIVFSTGALLYKLVKYKSLTSKIKEKREVEKKIKERILKELIESEGKDLSLDEKTAREIIEAAQKGDLDPSKILEYFLFKACSVDKELNCITSVVESSKDQALKLAYAANPQSMLLYGLPVSLKDCFFTKGDVSVVGLVDLLSKPAKEDGVVAKVLKHCGAIPFVKTNVSQLMLSFTSCNPIYGETSNPHRFGFSPGGSSSGEGSLIGAGGSFLGIGTDIAGSIRMPCHMCGICGLKPTMNRISKKGTQGSILGQTLISSTLGPMAKDVDTLILAMSALLCPLMFKLDPYIPPFPFDMRVINSTTKLRIGWYDDDGYNKPIPAVQRAVHLAKKTLESRGHTLVPFKIPKIHEAMKIYTSALFADGGVCILKRIRTEIEEPRLKRLYRKFKLPKVCRWILSTLIGIKWPRIGQDLYLHGGESCKVDRLWNLECQAAKYKDEFFACWQQGDDELDGLICPPFPIVTAPYKEFENLTGLASYTALFNLVNCPAGVVPVTKVTKGDLQLLGRYVGHHIDPWDSAIKSSCKDSLDMPVGVQCVAKPWRDEMCLKIMQELELSLRLAQ